MSTRARVGQIAREFRSFIGIKLARLGVQARDLDDVRQEVLIGAADGLDSFDPERAPDPARALESWLAGICERQAATYRRRAWRRAEDLVEEVPVDPHPADERHDAGDTEARLLLHERAAVAMALMEKLEPSYREAFLAHEVDEVSMAEFARAKGVPVNTGWNWLRLARRDLAAEWTRWCARARLGEVEALR